MPAPRFQDSTIINKPIKLSQPNGSPITNYREWTRPKKDYQWKAGRSAMELARSWFRDSLPSPPSEFLSLFSSHYNLNNIQLVSGIPELVTTLPERGEGRNHDLALIGKTDTGDSVTVCVEAKADEPFGNHTIGEYWNAAIKKREKRTPTRVPERIEALLRMVEPAVGDVHDSVWWNVKYQLLTALCGTILQAQIDDSDSAVLVIHEFETSEIDITKQKENHGELEKFLSVLAGDKMNVEVGVLYGEFIVGGIQVYVGKVATLNSNGI